MLSSEYDRTEDGNKMRRAVIRQKEKHHALAVTVDSTPFPAPKKQKSK